MNINKIKSGMKTNKFGKISLILTASLMLFAVSCNNDDNDFFDPRGTAAFQRMAQQNHNLWSEHMQWTYTVVDYFFHNPEGLGPQVNRLLQNQQDIGDAMGEHFGNQHGDDIADLLTTHILDAVPVLTAAQEGDDEALAESLDIWYENAQDVGDKFAEMNPEFWGQNELRDVWKTHITQTVTYSVDLLMDDFDQSIIDYQTALNHMINFSDILTQGIADRFPEKFRQ